MSDSYTLHTIFVETAAKEFEIIFEEAELFLDMPGPFNLKSWYVVIKGLNAESADRLDDCFYYGSPELILSMKTPGGKKLSGEVIIRSIAVGPHSRARMDGHGLLRGFESLG
ncbi:hypothetical protein [Desmospora profundinema]|uniref:Uncharacterized protein n=1 Tax=Desmospora profundinema TaxID=1571184 RepID=A0ABU1INT8_9BACL|nr:hypothetical protein [Desmospora profundinema]MDR6226442.1 hypothetical protein [Desmospora profundinema]